MENMEDKALMMLLGEVNSKYSEENKIILVPNKIAKKHNGYCSMQADILIINEYLEALKNPCSELVKSAITYSIVSLYAKCFTDASKHRNPKLELGLFSGNESLLETHEFLMDVRHNFLSHRGDTYNEVGIAFFLVPNDTRIEERLEYMRAKRNGFFDHEIEAIEKLMIFMNAYIMEQINKTGMKVLKQFLTSSPEEIKSQTINDLI